MPTDPIQRAVQTLKAGGLVAFPTETVYGLGADARNPDAVRKIFAVKGRPSNHPLIVHVGTMEELAPLARRIPDAARTLASRFWPGPLTLVVEKSDAVEAVVTGGQATVAVRVPSHPVALAMLRAFGGPVAAPSANRFGRVSPTTAEHVRSDLGDDVELILDGGSADVGVESTIVDVTGDPLRVLRLGGLGVEDLEAAVPGRWVTELDTGTGPGQLPSHYAPRAKVWLVAESAFEHEAAALAARGEKLAALVPEGTNTGAVTTRLVVPRDPDGYAHALYAALRTLDLQRPDVVLVVLPEERGVGRAVADRLRRAASPQREREATKGSLEGPGEITAPLAQNSG